MKAIVEIGGKQFSVKENDLIEVDRVNVEKGQEIEIKEVLAIGEGDGIKFGKPFVENASVKAEVVEHKRGDKIVVFKFKRRKGYRRKQGHRQELTKIKIKSISQ